MNNIPKVTKNLIIINVVMYIATVFNGSFMNNTFALMPVLSHDFHWWQFITYMFMHGGIFHIFFNMYTLMIFGSVIENVIGEKKFIVFYLLSGLGAAVLHTGMSFLQFNFAPMVGASGSIYGLLIAYAMLFPDSRMGLVFPPVTLKAKTMVLIFLGIELLTGVAGTSDGVAHFAHLGGMLIGFLLILYWKKAHKLFDKDVWI